MYDFAHTLSDAFEGTTHSLCTLEFEDHKPLYEWFLDNLELPSRPRQIEFSRLNVEHTITSKRKLTELIESKHVTGWDDPRMPTISGLRKRGYSPSAIIEFCKRVGITKKEKLIEMSMLESVIREELDKTAPRTMAVLDPVKVTIQNYTNEGGEALTVKNHPKDESMGTRKIVFHDELFIEREDFMEDPPEGFRRLTLGGEVRLKYAYIIKCEQVIKDDDGRIIELICSYDPDTKSGSGLSKKKVNAAIHWVSASSACRSIVNLYEPLFKTSRPETNKDINPHSIETIDTLLIENDDIDHGQVFQFERKGYFIADRQQNVLGQDAIHGMGDWQGGEDIQWVFNRIVTLKDSWAKIKNN